MITICNKTNHLFANYSLGHFKLTRYYHNFVVYYSNLKASTTYSTDLLRYDFDKGLLEPITIQTGRNNGAKYYTPTTGETSTNNLNLILTKLQVPSLLSLAQQAHTEYFI